MNVLDLSAGATAVIQEEGEKVKRLRDVSTSNMCQTPHSAK